MVRDIIFHHEDWQGVTLQDFLRPHWVRAQGTPLPPLSEASGEVRASVNQGRWIAECPDGCRNAIVVSQGEPYYICADCGSEGNGGRWYAVVFPRGKAAIEAELLKRPARRPFEAKTRNWSPGESASALRRENREHGVG